jgi:hypothetical protein
VTSTTKKILAIFGLAATALVALVLWKTGHHQEKADVSSRDALEETDISRQGGETSKRERALEGKIERLEAKVAMMGAANKNVNRHEEEDSPAEADRDPALEDPKARRAKLENLIAESTQRFEQQSYDADWADAAESELRRALSSSATDLGFKFQNVECRTTDCMATVEFDNYEIVMEKASMLAMQNYSVNCKTRVVTPQPDDVEEPYQVKVFFRDCKKGEEQI